MPWSPQASGKHEREEADAPREGQPQLVYAFCLGDVGHLRRACGSRVEVATVSMHRASAAGLYLKADSGAVLGAIFCVFSSGKLPAHELHYPHFTERRGQQDPKRKILWICDEIKGQPEQ